MWQYGRTLMTSPAMTFESQPGWGFLLVPWRVSPQVQVLLMSTLRGFQHTGCWGQSKDLSVSQSLLSPGARTYGPNLLLFGSYHQCPHVTYPLPQKSSGFLWGKTKLQDIILLPHFTLYFLVAFLRSLANTLFLPVNSVFSEQQKRHITWPDFHPECVVITYQEGETANNSTWVMFFSVA